MVCDFDWAIA